MVSTPQVVKQDFPHCNNQLLGNINILESTKLSFNCGQIPVRLCYGIQIISKSIVFSLPPFWITRHGKMDGIIHDYMLLKICNNRKYSQIIKCTLMLYKIHVFQTLLNCADMDKTEDPLASSEEEMDSSAPAAAKKDRTRDMASGSSYQPSRPS